MTTRPLAVLTALALGVGCTGNPFDKPTEKEQEEGPVTEVSLDPPAEGAGFQYVTGEFEVPSGMDLQQCYFVQIPGEGTDPVWVNKFVIAQTDGTHHMNIFRVKTIVRNAEGEVQLAPSAMGGPESNYSRSENGEGPCFDSANWADWPLVVNSQIGGHVEWEMPSGVAHKFEPGEWLMLQTHYVNAATQETPAKGNVFVNFHTQAAATVQHEVGSLFATKQSIRICQHDDRSKFHGTCQFDSDEPIRIIGANGHFHSRGRQFEMYTWDGTSVTTPPMENRFYVSDAWYDPPMLRSPELDRQVPAGGGIWYTCSYDWEAPPPEMPCSELDAKDKRQLGTPDEALDCCYTFGGPVDWAEHCNVFAYYYPKTDNILCY